jgi:DAHL domain
VRAVGFAILAVGLGAAALGAGRYERRAAEACAHRGEDTAQIDDLLGALTMLETSVLETRAGIQLNFDSINRAVLALRAAPRVASLVRGRGSAYAQAAESIDGLAEDMRKEEASLETLKTDIALLRLSSRYFPTAAEALAHRDEATAERLRSLRTEMIRATQELTKEDAWRIAARLATIAASRAELETRTEKVTAVRGSVERYEESPTGEGALRLEADISALAAAREGFDEATRGDLDSLLGHARSILDRRERVDRLVRGVVRSPIRQEVQAARAAYENASRQELRVELGLRILAAAVGVAALVLLGAAVWLHLRQGLEVTDPAREPGD